MKRICLLSILHVRGISPVFADNFFGKILQFFIAKKCVHCRPQPFQHLPESTIFPIQGLRIWLVIRGISPVSADIYFAKILHSFYRKKFCALPIATITTFVGVGVNYITHSGTKNLATDSRYLAGFRGYLFCDNTP
jgi:hypothetical protein